MSNDSMRSAMIAHEIAQIRSKLSAAQKEFDNLDIWSAAELLNPSIN